MTLEQVGGNITSGNERLDIEDFIYIITPHTRLNIFDSLLTEESYRREPRLVKLETLDRLSAIQSLKPKCT